MNKYEETKSENYEIGVNIIKSLLQYKDEKKSGIIDYSELLKEIYEKRQKNDNYTTAIEIKQMKWYQKVICFFKNIWTKH